jgi:hypothetical protein
VLVVVEEEVTLLTLAWPATMMKSWLAVESVTLPKASVVRDWIVTSPPTEPSRLR